MTAESVCAPRVAAKPHLKLIRIAGHLVGYRVYRADGFLGARRFAGYHYLADGSLAAQPGTRGVL